jgi:hypothetical protein
LAGYILKRLIRKSAEVRRAGRRHTLPPASSEEKTAAPTLVAEAKLEYRWPHPEKFYVLF